MGAKDSKPSFISYEDAVKRVSDSELRRIREAFKRCAGVNGTALSLEAFVHEVLCDGVPYEVAEWLYQACGGTKRGIPFRELLCGIVVLTKGSIEEKIKFLWTLYVNNQGDNGTYLYKRDFTHALHFENTSLPVTGAQRSGEVLTKLFGIGDRVTYEQFRSWLLIHRDATVLSKWLLSDRVNVAQDLETPTFYQSLAGVTHLEERDIIELEKCFWSLRNSAPTGELDAESLSPLLSPPLPRAAVAGAFLAFDENRDGHVDFKELCCGLSAACRGPKTERLKFCFKIFDTDRDGVLNKKELIDMVGILCTVANEALKNSSRASTPSDGNDSEGTEKGFDPEAVLLNLRGKLVAVPRDGRRPRFQLGATGDEDIVVREEPVTEDEGLISSSMALTQEDFLIWSVESAEALVSPFLELLVEICHVVLGLRPQCRHQERDIVLGWLRREVSRGFSVGQFWYLVGAEWWSSWLAYCSGGGQCAVCRPRVIDEAIVCDESFTSNSTVSTESMGSLLWRCETASLGSASSSGVSSAVPANAHANANHVRTAGMHPGPIDNKRLLAPNPLKVPTLTGEGGHLRRDATLSQHRDFELLPDAAWRALANWYGGPDPLPRQVIRPPNSDVELELYPLHLKLYRHVATPQRSMVGTGIGAGAAMYSSVPLAPAPPERQLAYTAAFSRLATVKQVSEFLCQALGLAREDMRLWSLSNNNTSSGSNAVLLDDERPSLQELRCDERQRMLVEVRNADLTWPEEIGALSLLGSSGGSSSGRLGLRRDTLLAPDVPGATGLHNLGNTCFMNAALQSVWNTGPLTRYFNSGMHLYEVNTTNPLGTKGALALRYGELCKEVWSCSARSVAPLRVRWCVSRHARHLASGQQHDAQELLAWLLDTLHEDLNRVAPSGGGIQHNDSDGRPDEEVAREAWASHTSRNASVMTELFYGQLKSKVACEACGQESVRFEAFNMLSLPLPMECFVRCQVRVMLLDGSVPVKYGVRVNSEGTYFDLKKKLSELCGLAPDNMLIVELSGATIGRVFEDNSKILLSSAKELFAYETPVDAQGHGERLDDATDDEGVGGTPPSGWAEVSVGRGEGASSLCMPALFCFKRSRSEIVMSQSPPGLRAHAAGYHDANARSNTLPRDLTELKRAETNGKSSPTLSVRSLTLRPSSPRLGKLKLGSAPHHMDRLADHPPIGKIHYLVAVHRKQCRLDAYFLPAARSRPALFGVPLLVRATDGMSGRQLHAQVWQQVARLLSARPPSHDHANHATDCDDSLGYEFPFTLRLVAGDGRWCARCPWPRLCRGCKLPCHDRPLLFGCTGNTPRPRKRSMAPNASEPAFFTGNERDLFDVQSRDVPSRDVLESRDVYDGGEKGSFLPGGSLGGSLGASPVARAKMARHNARLSHDASIDECDELSRLDFSELRQSFRRSRSSVMLAIDWDPTALHLRYQSTREKAWIEHSSVSECLAEAAKPIDLASCLRAFTSEEKLEERYHCSACRSAQPATKKLQIWRAPPILIIHLKRFQYVNSKWIKSQKVVHFPFQEFDPTAFLASVPQETILRHRELSARKRPSLADTAMPEPISESESEDEAPSPHKHKPSHPTQPRTDERTRPRPRLESTSLANTPVRDDNLVDYHQHHLRSDQDPFDLKYRLYAVVSHSGQMSGGHYVAYCRNPSGSWLCYNDSSCRELTASHSSLDPPIDPASAYLLFYERQGLDYDRYLPDISGKEPVIRDSETLDPDESDLKKMCVLA